MGGGDAVFNLAYLLVDLIYLPPEPPSSPRLRIHPGEQKKRSDARKAAKRAAEKKKEAAKKAERAEKRANRAKKLKKAAALKKARLKAKRDAAIDGYNKAVETFGDDLAIFDSATQEQRLALGEMIHRGRRDGKNLAKLTKEQEKAYYVVKTKLLKAARKAKIQLAKDIEVAKLSLKMKKDAQGLTRKQLWSAIKEATAKLQEPMSLSYVGTSTARMREHYIKLVQRVARSNAARITIQAEPGYSSFGRESQQFQATVEGVQADVIAIDALNKIWKEHILPLRLGDTDQIQIEIASNDGEFNYHSKVSDFGQFSLAEFTETMAASLQSFQEATDCTGYSVKVHNFRLKKGGAKRLMRTKKDLKNKKFWNPPDKRGTAMCADLCFVREKAKKEMQDGLITKNEFRKWRSKKRLFAGASELREKFKKPEDELAGNDYLRKVADDWNWTVLVIELNREVTFVHPKEAVERNSRDHTITLFYCENHFQLATAPTQFYEEDYFCMECLVPFRDKRKHSCSKRMNCEFCEADYCDYVPELDDTKQNHQGCEDTCCKPFNLANFTGMPIPTQEEQQPPWNDEECLEEQHLEKLIAEGKKEPREGDWIECEKCNFSFPTQQCHDNHIETKKCERFWKCKDCGKNCRTDREVKPGTKISKKEFKKSVHKCGNVHCRICQKFVEMPHKCFVPKSKSPMNTKQQKNSKEQRTICFDFEAIQDGGEHHMNAVFAKYEKEDMNTKAFTSRSWDTQKYGKKKEKWKYLNTASKKTNNFAYWDRYSEENRSKSLEHADLLEVTDKFCEWLFQGDHKGYTAIAHNGQGYDFLPIKDWAARKGHHVTGIVPRGGKYLGMEICGVKLIDSLSFVPAALASFPKMFGLKETRKGFFPHWKNVWANQDYSGKFPATKYYKPNRMKAKKRAEFLEWHKLSSKHYKKQKQEWNMEYELMSYCASDVQLLHEGIAELKRTFTENCDIDPTQFITIAQVCNNIYRAKHMPKDSIAILPRVHKRHEKFRQEYLAWQGWMNGEEMLPSEEKHVSAVGSETGIKFVFAACYHNGCPSCYRNSRGTTWINPDDETAGTTNHRNGLTMDRTHENWKREVNKLKGKVHIKWQCEWNVMKSKSREIREWLAQNDQIVVDRLDARDALFGGRTNATKLLAKFGAEAAPKQGYKRVGKYIDICSLYPTVQWYDEYPLGHHTVHTEVSTDLTSGDTKIKGLVKCDVLPPRGQYHPVLPARINGKTCFAFCTRCTATQQRKCDHSDEIRKMHGTWTTFELERAVQKGYEIKQVYEAWHWEEWTTDLFKKYVQLFLKIKTEASGYPHWCKTKEQQDAFRARVEEVYGFKIKHEDVDYNPGKRTMAKLCLNNLWGKFCQRDNLNKTVQVNNADDYYKWRTNEKITILKDKMIKQNELHEIVYKTQEEAIHPLKFGNVAIGVFTTSHARLRLYDKLDQLGIRVCYYDTDSVIYYTDVRDRTQKLAPKKPRKKRKPMTEEQKEKCRENLKKARAARLSKTDKYLNKDKAPGSKEWFLAEGDFLGQWTDELDGGHMHDFFVSSGAKSYGYRYKKKDGSIGHCMKVKGFTLNHENSEVINPDSLVRIVLGTEKRLQTPDYQQITRKNDRLINRTMNKKLRLTYDKRVQINDGENIDSMPWGA